MKNASTLKRLRLFPAAIATSQPSVEASPPPPYMPPGLLPFCCQGILSYSSVAPIAVGVSSTGSMGSEGGAGGELAAGGAVVVTGVLATGVGVATAGGLDGAAGVAGFSDRPSCLRAAAIAVSSVDLPVSSSFFPVSGVKSCSGEGFSAVVTSFTQSRVLRPAAIEFSQNQSIPTSDKQSTSQRKFPVSFKIFQETSSDSR